MTKLIKHDQGKRQYALFPTKALGLIQDVIDYGAKKYAPNNWRNANGCDDLDRYYSACLRHLFAFRDGDPTDIESGLSHLAHAACNIIFLLELTNEQESKD